MRIQCEILGMSLDSPPLFMPKMKPDFMILPIVLVLLGPLAVKSNRRSLVMYSMYRSSEIEILRA